MVWRCVWPVWGLLRLEAVVSLYSVVQGPLLRRYSALQFTTYAIWTGTVCLWFAAPGAVLSVGRAELEPTVMLVYLGLFPGALGYIAWSYALSKIPSSRAGSFLATIPVVALAISWMWLGEVPSAISLAGGAIVLAGVHVVNRYGGGRS